jgi:hypothetical protein
MPKALRHTLLAIAIGAMPLIAAAQTNSSSTTGTTATPSTSPTTNSMHGNTMRSADNGSAYGQAIAACEKKPMSERTACRQAADSQFGKGGGETAGTTGNSTAAGNPGTAGASSANGATGSNSGMGTSGTTGSSSGMGTSGTGTSGTSGSSSGSTGGGTGSGTGK